MRKKMEGNLADWQGWCLRMRRVRVAVEKERLYLKLRAFPIRTVKQKKTEAAEVLRRNIRFIILRIMRYGPDFFSFRQTSVLCG